jgi:type IV pilus assembly protein PilC
VEAAVEGLLSMMEPAIIIILGGVIGFIVIALYMPIFSLGDAVSQG